MPFLNKKNTQLTIKDSFFKLKDTIYGGRAFRINKEKERYDSDYINVSVDFEDNNSDVFFDKDVGINKKYWYVHDINWSDEYKNINIQRRREINRSEVFFAELNIIKQEKKDRQNV